MTVQEWLEGNDPKPMLEHLGDEVSSRKLRLFAIACCRDVWEWMPDERSRNGVEAAEKYADGLIADDGLAVARAGTAEAWTTVWSMGSHIYQSARTAHYALDLKRDVLLLAAQDAANAHWNYIKDTLQCAGDSVEAQKAMSGARGRQVESLRDIFGNPFRPVTLDPRWLSSTVIDLARTIYEDRLWERMPILADALMDAGCDNDEIINHCRGPGPHVRGCWVVDLLTGRE